VLTSSGIDQNARNEKAREDEEKVHSTPAKPSQLKESVVDLRGRLHCHEMKKHHQNDCDTANSVQAGDCVAPESFNACWLL
jgi:hypothetical protein